MSLFGLVRSCLVVMGLLLGAAGVSGAQAAEALPPPVELVPQLGHGADVRNLVFSRDGRFAASVDEAGTLKVWELQHGFEFRSVFTTSGRSVVLGFSADSRTVYVTGQEGLAIVDVSTGKAGRAADLRPELLMSDARTYIQSWRRKGVVVGDLQTRKEEAIAGIADEAVVNEGAAAGRIAVLHISDAREILVVDVDSRTIRRRIAIDATDVDAIAVSSDANYAAIIERNERGPVKLAVFHLETGRQTVAFDAPGTTRFYATAFLPGTSQFAVGGSLDLGGIRLFDAQSGSELAPLAWPREHVNFIAADPVGGRLAIVSKSYIELRRATGSAASEQRLGPTGNRASLIRSAAGGYYAVRDPASDKLTVYGAAGHDMLFETPVTRFSSAAFLGDRAVMFQRDGALWLKPLPAGGELKLAAASGRLNNVVGAASANMLAYSGSLENALHVVSLKDDYSIAARNTFDVGGVTDRGLALSPDGLHMLTRTLGDDALALRDTATGAVVSQLGQRMSSVFHTVRFSSDGRMVLFQDSHRVRVWRGVPWSLVYDRTSSRSIEDADFSPDGTQVWAVGRDGVFAMTLTRPYAEVSLAAVRGRALVSLSGAQPGGIVIEEEGGRTAFQIATATGGTLELRGNASTVRRAVISSDGAHVATSERDRRLAVPLARVWDANRGTVACHLDRTYVLGTHPGGWIVATNGEVRLLGLSDCAVEARLHVGQPALGGLIEAMSMSQGEVLGVTSDGQILVLDLKRGLHVASHRLPSGIHRPALVYQLNAVAYFDSQQKAVRVVEPHGLSEVARLELKDELPTAINGVPGTSLLVIATSGAGGPGRVRVWDVREKRVVRETAIGNLSVSAATVDLARGLLLVGFERGLLGWWRLDSDKPEHGVVAHYGAVTTIRSLTDGRIFTAPPASVL